MLLRRYLLAIFSAKLFQTLATRSVKQNFWNYSESGVTMIVVVRVRMICRRINSNHWFDHSILVIIALNCITLAMERPAIPPASVVSRRQLQYRLSFPTVEIAYNRLWARRGFPPTQEEFSTLLFIETPMSPDHFLFSTTWRLAIGAFVSYVGQRSSNA